MAPRTLLALLVLTVSGLPAFPAEPPALPTPEQMRRSLENEFRVPPIAAPETSPGLRARMALDLARREVAALRSELRPWEKDPRAKLLTDGRHTEHGIRPNTQPMPALATVVRWGIAGQEQRDTLADLIAMLRFVATTHSAGPQTASTGQKWQNQWQSALWAAQAGLGAWMVWEKIDEPELHWLIANMVASEADRFVDQQPPFQIKRDTKAEENVWNSFVVALAANLLPNDPRQAKWRETAVRWQLSSLLTEADAASERVIDGRPLRDWGFQANLHPDHTLENRGRVHPSYMTTFAALLSQKLLYAWGGQPAPEALSFNSRAMYDHLKFLSHADGQLHHPNGQDWELHRYYPHTHALMSALEGDAEAAWLEQISLETTARMQGRTPSGATLLPSEYFFPSLPGAYAWFYAVCFLAHLQFGEGPPAITAEEFEKRFSGVRLYEPGEFLAQRSPAGFVSFSWGHRVMGMAIPLTKDLLGTPFELGYVGQVSAATKAPPREKPRPDVPRLEHIQTAHTRESFQVAATLTRAAGAVEQQIAFISLPGGVVVYAERLKARQAFTPADVKTGMIGVLNEPESVFQNGPRQLRWQGGQRAVDGLTPQPQFTIEGPWLNIDERWGFIALGDSEWRYEPNHEIHRGRREQLLYLNPPAARNYAAGETLATRAAVTLLNHDAKATQRLAKDLRKSARTGADELQLKISGRRITVSFGDQCAVQVENL